MPPSLSSLKSAEVVYRPILVLSFGGFIFALGSAAMWFVFPIIAEKLFKDLFVVGLLLAIPSLIAMFFDIPVGGLSDYTGRKRIFLTGLVIMALMGLALPSVDDLLKFAVFMVLFGFGNLSIVVPVRAYIMDVAPKTKTSEFFGITWMGLQMGYTIGPVIAGYMIADNLGLGVHNSGVFYCLACLASALILIRLKETVYKGSSTFASIKDVIRKDKVYSKSMLDYKTLHYAGAAVFFSTFIVVFVDGLIWSFEPLYTTYGIDSSTVGVIMSLFILPFILFSVPAGLIADKIGKTRVFIAGLICSGIFLIIFGLTKDTTVLMISAFASTTGLALARPAIDGFLADISSQKERGGIVGVWNVAEDSAYVASPIIGGAIAESFGIGSAFTAIGCMLILSAPLIYLATKKKTNP